MSSNGLFGKLSTAFPKEPSQVIASMTEAETTAVDWRLDGKHVWSEKGLLAEKDARDAKMREIDIEPDL